MKLLRFLPILFLFLYVFILYRQFIFSGKLPIPADTIVGLYHPWRDSLANQYPNGIPFKNFQITDSVRQQFPWRELSLNIIKNGRLPLWNPYSGVGVPLLANLQSAIFYPLNILYLLPIHFYTLWSLQVLLQPLLGGIFMWLYLRHLKVSFVAQTLGVLCWIGSGFFVAWQQWNTTVHVVIWLPLILLSIDRIIFTNKKIFWSTIFIVSLGCSFLAGYLQPFFYVFVFSLIYTFVRIFQSKLFRLIPLFAVLNLLFIILTLPQWLATFQYIGLSARDIDQANWNRPDWFLPWQNLAQFIAPDFFGNPSTLNYFGIWNYQEFVGYIGIVGLLFSLLALFSRRDKSVLFFAIMLFASLLLVLPTPIAQIPYRLQIPFLSTAQPSRLIVIVDFCLAILASLGLDFYLRGKKANFLPPAILVMSLIALWVTAVKFNLTISLHNLYLPTILVILTVIFYLTRRKFLIYVFLLLTLFDLLRFSMKFEPFSESSWLYPTTTITKFLTEASKGNIFRVAALDDRIFPPNFSVAFRLQMVSLYDPLFPRRYGEFIKSVESNTADISSALGFNRIIVPKNYQSKLFPLLNVKYLLSFEDITSPSYKFLFSEGKTKLYESKNFLPRAFFVDKVITTNKTETLGKMFAADFNPSSQAIVETDKAISSHQGNVVIQTYNENIILLKTENSADGFLVLTDQYYPNWKATIDNTNTMVYITDYTFRGVFIPAGQHEIKYYYSGL